MKYIPLLLLIITLSSCKDQLDNIDDKQAASFIKFFGGTGQDIGNDVRQTSDNGYALVGTVASPDKNKEVVFIKTDKFGNMEWKQVVGNDGDDFGNSFIIDNKGDFIIVGTTTINDTTDIYLIKLSAAGDTLWTRSFHDDDNLEGICLAQNSDNEIFVAGNMNNSILPLGKSIYMLKVNDTAVSRSINPGGICNAIIEAQNNYFIISGKNQNGYPFFIAVNEKIITGKSHTLTDIANTTINEAVIGAQGEFTLVGTSSTGNNSDIQLLQINGNILADSWEGLSIGNDNSFGGNLSDEASSIDITKDNNFIILGTTESSGAGAKDIYLLKVDTDGSKVIDTHFGYTDDDLGRKLRVTEDGGFVITGAISSDGNQDICLIKTDNNGNLDIE